ncbi:hypothetical protein DXC92_00715 [Clostridiales bacterium TF09-2AC]|nr:hypothetical protein DXC92_00715 [Clostridiales bacterium TF09-2AC]
MRQERLQKETCSRKTADGSVQQEDCRRKRAAGRPQTEVCSRKAADGSVPQEGDNRPLQLSGMYNPAFIAPVSGPQACVKGRICAGLCLEVQFCPNAS